MDKRPSRQNGEIINDCARSVLARLIELYPGSNEKDILCEAKRLLAYSPEWDGQSLAQAAIDHYWRRDTLEELKVIFSDILRYSESLYSLAVTTWILKNKVVPTYKLRDHVFFTVARYTTLDGEIVGILTSEARYVIRCSETDIVYSINYEDVL